MYPCQMTWRLCWVIIILVLHVSMSDEMEIAINDASSDDAIEEEELQTIYSSHRGNLVYL